jgi:hypothetical protein
VSLSAALIREFLTKRGFQPGEAKAPSADHLQASDADPEKALLDASTKLSRAYVQESFKQGLNGAFPKLTENLSVLVVGAHVRGGMSTAIVAATGPFLSLGGTASTVWRPGASFISGTSATICVPARLGRPLDRDANWPQRRSGLLQAPG